jgi:nucleolar protein 53
MSERDRGKKTLAKKAAQHSSDESDDGEEKLARRRFGKVQMPSAPLEVQLPDELEDSLRRLKPQGNLLTDRYRNMLLNGKVEVRKRLGQQKQPKTERYEKWSYKDWKLK